MKKISLILSCEHAVNTVPLEYRELFVPYNELLNSHRGVDFGSREISEHIHQHLTSFLYLATATRLLIDCNRSINHPGCYSEVTKNLSLDVKEEISTHYYWPYRHEVIKTIEQEIAKGNQVWHLSIHSFTPILNGEVRNAELGFLYDPKKTRERQLSLQLARTIKTLSPNYRIRMNYPYIGTSNGFTTSLRKQYVNSDYLGIEIEANQAITQDRKELGILKEILSNGLGIIVNNCQDLMLL